MTTPPWLDEFRSELDAEFAGRPRIAALATADPGGIPHVRHVVVRRVGPDGSTMVATDAASAKVAQLQRRPIASISFWLDILRIQYRLDGPVDLATAGPEWLAIWRELSDSARALFHWPEPGTPRGDETAEAFPRGIEADVEPPPRFVVLRLHPVVVERLDLRCHPHERRRWVAVPGATPWECQLLNP